MNSNQVASRVLGAATAVALLLSAPVAFGFAEDICFPPGGGPPFNCLPLPAVCEPVGSASPLCLAAAAVEFGVEDDVGPYLSSERSIVHADCVNLLAQAVGFSTDDANWI